MLRFLVCFDIPDDSTRKEIGDLLEEHGVRVQRSVFEVAFKSEASYRRLLHHILSRIDQEADSVRFYSQCERCVAKAFELGDFPDPFDSEAVYIF